MSRVGSNASITFLTSATSCWTWTGAGSSVAIGTYSPVLFSSYASKTSEHQLYLNFSTLHSLTFHSLPLHLSLYFSFILSLSISSSTQPLLNNMFSITMEHPSHCTTHQVGDDNRVDLTSYFIHLACCSNVMKTIVDPDA